MKPFIPRASTLWIPNTGPATDPGRGHLFVSLTDTCDAGQNLLVPFCSEVPKCDRTCLLGPGDHSFFKHLSYAFYAQMKWYGASVLAAKIKSKEVEDRGLIDEKVFALICEGVTQSRFSMPKAKSYFAEQSALRKIKKA